MHDTHLIFVEGLPGLGKTTTASWLAARLRAGNLAATLYLESQAEHPINVGGELHPAGDVTGERFFQKYRPATFMEESLRRWQAFVGAALRTDAINVLDSYPFQNSVRILLQMDASFEEMRTYAAQVEALVMPLRPLLIYFSHRDAAHAEQHFAEIAARRGQAWLDYVAQLVSQCPYAVARRLTGPTALWSFLRDYKQLTDALLAESHLHRLVLGECTGQWDDCYRQVEAFLGL